MSILVDYMEMLWLNGISYVDVIENNNSFDISDAISDLSSFGGISDRHNSLDN